MTKLLDKPLKAFAIYALIILILSIPAYVLVIEKIWVHEIDENNWLTLQHTKNRLQSKAFTPSEIENINHIWGELQPGVSIEKANTNLIFQDSIYEAIRPNEYDLDDGEDRFRGLKSQVFLNGEPYLLTIETNFEETDETLTEIAFVTFLFFLILILGFVFINRKISSKTWQPFRQTLSALKSFEISKEKSIQLPDTDIHEFQELNHSLHHLIENSVDAYLQQKAFTENASHELQTPIALLKSKMDILLQQRNLSPEISELLNQIEAPLSRLSRINKNLLLLAKVENHQFIEQGQIDLKEYLENIVVLFEDYFNEKQLQIFNSLEEPVFVTANSFLAETLLHNLLSNAIRHTSKGGQINIDATEKSIIISNSGNESLDQTKIFQRFSNSSREKVGSGLGLAIIREIATIYGWQVIYSFECGRHEFTVML